MTSSNTLLTDKKDSALIISIWIFFVSLFLYRVASVYTTGMCLAGAVALFYHNTYREKIQLLKCRKHLWFMFAFAVFLLVSLLLSENKIAGTQFLLRRIPLFIFPLTIGMVSFSRKQRDSILLGAGVIVSIACLCSLGYAFYKFRQTNDAAWLYNDALSDLIRQQSIYTSVLVNISIYSFINYLLVYRVSNWSRFGLVLGVGFLFIISYLLASRNMMLMLYASVFIFLIYIILKKRKYAMGIGLLALISILISVILIFFPKTINRFRELAFTGFKYDSQASESHYGGELTPEQWNGANFRLAAWPCGWQVFKQHPVFGVGLGDKKDELMKVYKEKKFVFAITTGKNIHNNYLDILMGTGLTGLFLFLMGWAIFPLIKIKKNRDIPGFLILLTFLIAMITENYFDRSLGVVLFGFFIPFLSSMEKEKQEANQ